MSVSILLSPLFPLVAKRGWEVNKLGESFPIFKPLFANPSDAILCGRREEGRKEGRKGRERKR